MRIRFWSYLRRHHLALLALFVALGGTSYAATSLPANSVGTSQIRDQAVTLQKIKLAAQRALRGRTGATGKQGPRGAAGATHVVVRTGSAMVAAGPDQLGDAQANCNPGEHATGGGEFISPTSGAPEETIRISAPSVQAAEFPGPASAGDVPDAWFVEVLNNVASQQSLSVYVVCASP